MSVEAVCPTESDYQQNLCKNCGICGIIINRSLQNPGQRFEQRHAYLLFGVQSLRSGWGERGGRSRPAVHANIKPSMDVRANCPKFQVGFRPLSLVPARGKSVHNSHASAKVLDICSATAVEWYGRNRAGILEMRNVNTGIRTAARARCAT